MGHFEKGRWIDDDITIDDIVKLYLPNYYYSGDYKQDKEKYLRQLIENSK